jgi:hypothetical protein
VWWPDGTCAGAVTVLVLSRTLPPRLADLVSHAARCVGTTLSSTTQ